MAGVVVAVVSWNTRDLLAACLDSLAADAQSGRAEVWVVDNASSDGSAELVAERYRWAHLIASDQNLGFGPAVNRAVAQAGEADWIAIANADVALEPGALRTLIAAGERDPGAGVLAPRLVIPGGETQHSLHPFPSLGFTLLFNLGWQRVARRWADRMCLEGYWDPDRARRAPWAVGALLLVRRAAWEAVGGFDEQRWMYAEDLDLGWRLARAGWATRYEPAARARHAVSAATTQAWGEERTARWQRETYRWLAEQRGGARAKAIAAINLAGAGWRWAWLAAAARVMPGRFATGRDTMYAWARLHAAALRRSPASRRPEPPGGGGRP